MNKQVIDCIKRPELYAKSTAKFWDDEHISIGMLEAHLNPEWDAATRKISFVNASVDWIEQLASSNQYKKLLDMGCGPGIYAEKLCQKGYQVTGIDLSTRSIDYAKEHAVKEGLDICYLNENYLNLNYEEEYDVIILIYCDFGVLSDEDRAVVLKNVYRALKKGGKFFVDVFTPKQYEDRQESNSWQVAESGFWSPQPHLALNSMYRYEGNTILNQTVIVTENTVNCYNIWEHMFTQEELRGDMELAGFPIIEVYGDAAGEDYLVSSSTTMCMVATK